MVTLGGNAVGVSFGTLGESVGQSGCTKTSGAGRDALRAGAVGVPAVTLDKCGRVFGWWLIDRRPALRTGLEWGFREPRRLCGRPWWRRLWICRMGRGNCEGKTPQFWRCVIRGYVGCRGGDISSGQGRVRGTTHKQRGGGRCGGCQVPGGARGVQLKSNAPFNWAFAESLGLRWEGRRRLSVRVACRMRRSQRCKG